MIYQHLQLTNTYKGPTSSLMRLRCPNWTNEKEKGKDKKKDKEKKEVTFDPIIICIYTRKTCITDQS